jgi:hypothetical protein
VNGSPGWRISRLALIGYLILTAGVVFSLWLTHDHAVDTTERIRVEVNRSRCVADAKWRDLAAFIEQNTGKPIRDDTKALLALMRRKTATLPCNGTVAGHGHERP